MWKKRNVAAAVLFALSAVAVSRVGVNTAPVMSVLADTSGYTGVAFAISGSCTDDGKPLPPTITYQWTKTGGAGSCNFASSTSASTTATCDTVGTPQLTLTCCDRGPASACTGLADTDDLVATISSAPLLDAIAAAGGSAAGGAYCLEKIRAAYSGPLIRVRRASDSTESDIGASGTALDTSALGAFCASTNCFGVTAYDQSGNARHLTQATTTEQPKIWDSASGLLTAGTHTMPAFAFVRASSQSLALTGTFVSGAVDYASMHLAQHTASGTQAVFGHSAMRVGSASSNAIIYVSGGSNNRQFTPSPALSTFSGWFVSFTGGTLTTAVNLRQNGANLSQASVTGSSSILFDSAGVTWGSQVDGSGNGLDGRSSCAVWWPATITGTPLALVDAWITAHI